jgi:hypothetical protein
MAKIKLTNVLGLVLALLQAAPAIVQATKTLRRKPPAE